MVMRPLTLSVERLPVRYSKFKTKAIFTFGIYLFVWRHQVATWLRDDFGALKRPRFRAALMRVAALG